MPTLADIYSLIDSAKRRAADTVQNPGASLSQFVESRLDPIRNLGVMSKESAEETARTGQLFGPKMRQLGEQYAESYNPGGMTILDSLAKRFPKVDLQISETPKYIDLNKIVVPQEMRGKGMGTEVMQDLIDYANQTGKQINLSPSSDFGGSITRLKKFYKELGFKENRGRTRDFSTRETMIKPPEKIKIDEITGLPLNSDKTVTLYHHTSPENADAIRKTGMLKSAAEPDVYLTTHSIPDTGYGEAVVPIKVNPQNLRLDDEFPNGRLDFAMSVGKPGGSIKVKPK